MRGGGATQGDQADAASDVEDALRAFLRPRRRSTAVETREGDSVTMAPRVPDSRAAPADTGGAASITADVTPPTPQPARAAPRSPQPQQSRQASPSPEMDEEKMRALVQNLGVPRSTLESLMRKVRSTSDSE
jgi:hypothetical protein